MPELEVICVHGVLLDIDVECPSKCVSLRRPVISSDVAANVARVLPFGRQTLYMGKSVESWLLGHLRCP